MIKKMKNFKINSNKLLKKLMMNILTQNQNKMNMKKKNKRTQKLKIRIRIRKRKRKNLMMKNKFRKFKISEI